MQYFFIWIDQYTDWVAHLVRTQSVLLPLFLILLEELGIPVILPGDVILAYTGYKVSKSPTTNFVIAFIVAMIAIIIGSSMLFFAAKKWGDVIITKLGKYIFLKESHIRQAEKLFARFGVWTIIIGRHIPGMRVPITLFSAISGIRYTTFILSTIFSAIFWVALYLNIGAHYGERIRQALQHYIAVSVAVAVGIVAAIILLHIWGIYKESKRIKKSEPEKRKK